MPDKGVVRTTLGTSITHPHVVSSGPASSLSTQHCWGPWLGLSAGWGDEDTLAHSSPGQCQLCEPVPW
jgi:hypothetical protein